MESRKGPKFRKKKKKKSDNRTLAERIMLEREAAAQEAERNSSKSQGNTSSGTSSEQKPAKDLSETVNTPGFEGQLSPSESVDISHLTKESDQKKRTPTPEPTLSASHSDQLPVRSSGERLSQTPGSAAYLSNDKPKAANNVQPSYQQPLQPAYAPHNTNNLLPNQNKPSRETQYPQQQIPLQQPPQTQGGPQFEVGRSIPATTTTASSSSSSASPIKDTVMTNASSVPPDGVGGHQTGTSHQQIRPSTHPPAARSDYNRYMSLAQKIVLQRKIVAVCDSVARQQQSPGVESNPENSEENRTSNMKENNQLPQNYIQNTALVAPEIPISYQESCPLSDKKCPIHSPALRNKDLSQQENSNEYKSSTAMRHTPQSNNNQTNEEKSVSVTELNNADQKEKPSSGTQIHQPVSRNGVDTESPKETLPTIPVNQNFDSMNHSEVEALSKMQPQQSPEVESNPENIEDNRTSNMKENNRLPQKDVQDMTLVASEIQNSSQESPPLSYKHLEGNKDLNQQGNSEEYKSSSAMRQTPQTTDNQTNNDDKSASVTDENKAGQIENPSNVTQIHEPVSNNGVDTQSPIQTLPTVPAIENFDSMNHSELEALEKMVDEDLQNLVSGTNTGENAPLINKDLRDKVLSEEFQRKIDQFLNDI